MYSLILLLSLLFFGWLVVENRLARHYRQRIAHVIHVNGTRGKSSVTRLIDAGLRAGGLRVFCKTTGTVPMTIGTDGIDRPIRRFGCANIREQLSILRQAAQSGAEVLVIECMAVDPAYQKVAQHRMLCADIGVITNVRLDHTDVMGETLPEIAEALSNTVPRGGVLFTAEQDQFPVLERAAQRLGTRAVSIRPDAQTGSSLSAVDFPENVALALAVCEHLGVSEEDARAGMAVYKRDPYALSFYRLENGGLFVNGLSINDPQSTRMVYESLVQPLGLTEKRVTLLLNNRGDRAARTMQMAELAEAVAPVRIWMLGANSGMLTRRLQMQMGEGTPPIKWFQSVDQLDFSIINQQDVIFAAGNIAKQGKELIERIKQEGEPYVL